MYPAQARANCFCRAVCSALSLYNIGCTLRPHLWTWQLSWTQKEHQQTTSCLLNSFVIELICLISSISSTRYAHSDHVLEAVIELVLALGDDVQVLELLGVLELVHGLSVITHLDQELVKIAPHRSDLEVEGLSSGIPVLVATLEHIEGPIPRIGNPNFQTFSTTSLG